MIDVKQMQEMSCMSQSL